MKGMTVVTNTNLHSYTPCACFKMVYKTNMQAVWLYYNLGYEKSYWRSIVACIVYKYKFSFVF